MGTQSPTLVSPAPKLPASAVNVIPKPALPPRAPEKVTNVSPEPALLEPVSPEPAKTNKDNKKKVSIPLFGTIEFKAKIKDMPKWQMILSKEAKNPSFTEKRMLSGKGSWKDLRKTFADLPLTKQAQAVNAFFNKWPYHSDIAVWGVDDYWATPVEFFQKSGDCEDYAIAKYFALKDLGVPIDSMRIVILQDTLRNLAHAVLVLYTDDDALVLDNLSNNLLTHRRLTNYKPQYSVNEKFRWVHMKPDKSTARKDHP